jgi:hypothetical protein
MNKKAQVTIFIIIGLIMLIALGLVLYFRTNVAAEQVIPEIAKTEQVPADVQPIKSYVESCLIEISTEALKKLGDRGGYIDPIKHGLKEGIEPTESDLVAFSPGSDLKVAYWYYLKSNNKCTGQCAFDITPENKLYLYNTPGKVSVESQLDDYINENLNSCLQDFNIFKEQGFTINELGQIKTTTKVGDNDIEFYVNLPLEVQRGSINRIEHFYVIILRKYTSRQ